MTGCKYCSSWDDACGTCKGCGRNLLYKASPIAEVIYSEYSPSDDQHFASCVEQGEDIIKVLYDLLMHLGMHRTIKALQSK